MPNCSADGSQVEPDLAHLTLPDWWIDMHKLNPSDRRYCLAKVAQIEFGRGNPSQVDAPSRVEIARIELRDRQIGYLYFLACFVFAVWGGFGYWFFRQYAAALATDLQAKMQKTCHSSPTTS